jgi:hypothetical protein
VLLVIPGFCQEDKENDASAGQHGGQQTHGTQAHKHHFGFFLGGTYGEVESHGESHRSGEETDAAHKEHDLTYGFDYQYIVNRYIGVGAIFDHAFRDFRTTVVAPGVFVKPVGGFQVLLAPGAEFHGDTAEFVFRLGFYYDFPLGSRFTISPTLAVDFLEDKHVWVYGGTFGVGFQEGWARQYMRLWGCRALHGRPESSIIMAV